MEEVVKRGMLCTAGKALVFPLRKKRKRKPSLVLIFAVRSKNKTAIRRATREVGIFFSEV